MANDVQDVSVIDKRARVTSEGYRDPFCRWLFSVDSRPQGSCAARDPSPMSCFENFRAFQVQVLQK
jgi:hypothetical protein